MLLISLVLAISIYFRIKYEGYPTKDKLVEPLNDCKEKIDVELTKGTETNIYEDLIKSESHKNDVKANLIQASNIVLILSIIVIIAYVVFLGIGGINQ